MQRLHSDSARALLAALSRRPPVHSDPGQPCTATKARGTSGILASRLLSGLSVLLSVSMQHLHSNSANAKALLVDVSHYSTIHLLQLYATP